ncbi:MAG TPA: hypothetical protein VGI82_10800 [Chitinophagaceae bacterium]|jgi:hypothetical protein
MKLLIGIFCVLAMIACHNNATSAKTTDSTSINTKTNSPADGGPNNGLGDTNTYNRSNDTIPPDSIQKK